MKKVLLGTSAIALAGAFATQASANEWQVKVGGYSERYVAYAKTDGDVPGDFDGVDMKSDSEIHFSPSITLDNGLTFSARIELEGATASDQIDETYADIKGSFGDIRIGEDDQVAYNMAYVAPDVTFLNINSGSDTKYWGGLLGTYTTTLPQAVTDPEGISYYSPRFAGFQVGASYARDGLRSTTQGQQDISNGGPGRAHDAWAVGANYVNSFGDFNVALSGGYAAADVDGVLGSGDVEAWGAGLNLGYGGFTIGGSYKENDVSDNVDGEVSCGCSSVKESSQVTESGDNTVWDAGVSYETGPWGFSFTYINFDSGESDDTQVQKYMLGMNYDLAKGVRLNAFGVYGDADAAGQDSEKGWIVGTGVRLDF